MPVVSSFNLAEIVILGGDSSIEGQNMILGDLHIFNVQSETLSAVPASEKNLKFQSSSNITVSCNEDKIYALVMASNGKTNLISYTKGHDAVQVCQF